MYVHYLQTLEDVFLSLCVEEGIPHANLQSVSGIGTDDQSSDELGQTFISVSQESASEVTPLLTPQVFKYNTEGMLLLRKPE